jgi:Outer membrane protein beta-barrel domain
MKKRLIAIALLCSATIASNAQLSLGVQAGASMVIPNIALLPDAKNVTFIQPGIIADYKLGGLLSIRPSLNFLKGGFTEESITMIGGITSTNVDKIRTNNLLIPIDLCVPIKAGPGRIVLSAGPTVVIGLSGNAENTTTTAGVASTPINKSITFGNATGDIKQINWGTNFGLGYSFNNGIDIRGVYNLGLTDQFSGITNSKSNMTSLMLAYYFIRPSNN